MRVASSHTHVGTLYTMDLGKMILNVYTVLSLVVLGCTVAAEQNAALVSLYTGSAVADCAGSSGGEANATNATLIATNASLQDALQQATSMATADARLTLCLRGGRSYNITSPIATSRSVALIGTDAEDDARIYCSYQPSDVPVIHTLYFNRSAEVRLEQLYFEGCAYPFRLELVHNVRVSHCTFR